MVRTQILLKERQYSLLKAEAHRQAKSISALLRQAVDRLLGLGGRTGAPRKLESLRGIGRDLKGPSGREHDSILYGWKK